MDLGAILIGIALLVGCLMYVLNPFQEQDGKQPTGALTGFKPSPQEQRQRILVSIRDLDFDYQIGKVTEEDYTRMRPALIQQAVQFTTDTSENDAIEALILARRQTLQQGPTTLACPHCGKKLHPGDHFCATCGAAVPGKCPGCGKTTQVGEAFCSACGRSLEPISVPMQSSRSVA